MNLSESLHRILQQDQTMADLFYLVFLERYPEVRHYFIKVDLQRQAVLLTSILMVLERHHVHAYPATTSFLQELGAKHYRWGIAPGLYPKFRDALLSALERFHSRDWTPSLAQDWRECIDRAIATMLDGYPEVTTPRK